MFAAGLRLSKLQKANGKKADAKICRLQFAPCLLMAFYFITFLLSLNPFQISSQLLGGCYDL
jgi:Kef-type K+ transport system membrane component KefB